MPDNHHCTCIQLGTKGIMIEGPSGSGKSSLALGILEAAILRGIEAKLICDDQALIRCENNKLNVCAPEQLAGKIEIYGAGITRIDFQETGNIDLVATLVTPEELPRYPDPETCNRFGLNLEQIILPGKNEPHAIRILFHFLNLPLLPS